MENTWITIALLLLVAIGLLYVGFKDDHPRSLIGWIRKIAGAFLATVGTLFFGLFGFNLALFDEENGSANPSEKSRMET